MHTPRDAVALHRPNARFVAPARDRVREFEAIPPGAEHVSAGVGNREGPSRRRDRGRRFGRGSHEIVLLVELVLHDVDQRRRERFQFAIDAAKANPPLLPQDVGAEQAQHDQQRDRVPQRESRAQGQRPHDASVPMTS